MTSNQSLWTPSAQSVSPADNIETQRWPRTAAIAGAGPENEMKRTLTQPTIKTLTDDILTDKAWRVGRRQRRSLPPTGLALQDRWNSGRVSSTGGPLQRIAFDAVEHLALELGRAEVGVEGASVSIPGLGLPLNATASFLGRHLDVAQYSQEVAAKTPCVGAARRWRSKRERTLRSRELTWKRCRMAAAICDTVAPASAISARNAANSARRLR